MGEFDVQSNAIVDADSMLKRVNSLSDLLKMEFTTDADNILLLRRGLELIVQELGKLNQKVEKK